MKLTARADRERRVHYWISQALNYVSASGEYVETDLCMPLKAAGQDMIYHVGHHHAEDYRGWVGKDLKAALREFSRR